MAKKRTSQQREQFLKDMAHEHAEVCIRKGISLGTYTAIISMLFKEVMAVPETKTKEVA